MKLTAEVFASPEQKAFLESKGYRLPSFDVKAMRRATAEHPTWVHFGAGNIFKAFPAVACQNLLDEGLIGTGIVAVDRRQKAAEDHDNLVVSVTLRSSGKVDKTVVGAVAEHFYLYEAQEDAEKLRAVFENPSLQMVSFTITEKGYALQDAAGNALPKTTPLSESASYMGRITALLHDRYLAGGAPLAMVSMDNCSHNGDKLKEAILYFAAVTEDEGFINWLSSKVSFPWSMIDKITPGPDASVAAMLTADGLDEGTPFVNAEESEYLVVEDDFPNGRPPLEKAGIYFTDRETVEKAERMKVCTCLNPLHTGLAVFGCLLGYDRIREEMKDEDLKKLAEKIGYKEGLPVVTDPGIISPKEFLDTVVEVRLPNPFLPDMPQRIATDTSQKLPIRFGETIKSYLASDTLKVEDLNCIPLVFAGWLRYLTAVDDEGNAFTPSSDPLLEYASAFVKNSDPAALEPLLRNKAIFGVDLIEAGLADKVCALYARMQAGPGAVRATLHEIVNK